MRADMAKVIVERPRFGSRIKKPRKGYYKELQHLGQSDLPKREGIGRRGGRTKHFNEHLGPLRRYLDSQVGRPWSKVHAEICSHVRRDSVVQDHVRDHVDQYVTTQVIEIDGVPCHSSGRWYGLPLADFGWFVRSPWYVCPRTGLLRRLKQVPRRSRRKTPVTPVLHVVSHADRLLQDAGASFLLTLQAFPFTTPFVGPRVQRFDEHLQRRVEADEASQLYGRRAYCVGKRRLTQAELKQLPVTLS